MIKYCAHALTHIFLVTLFIVTVYSCGCIEHEYPVSNENITIGILLPLSGSNVDRGLDCLNGSTLAIEDINSHGGIQSHDGKFLEMIIADSKGNPDIGAEETRKLIEDKNVVAIIGSYQSSVAIPATQVSEMYQTPFIVNVGISDIITNRGFQYTFRIIPKVGTYADFKVQFLSYFSRITKKPIEKVALLYENTAFGTGASLAERKSLKNADFEVVSDISYRAENITTLHDEIQKTLKAEPDAIFITTYLDDSILIARELYKTGFSGPVIDTAGGTISKEFIQRLGEEAEGIFSVSEYSYDSSYGHDLNHKFYNRFGMNISGDSAYTYQAVHVLKDALERASSINREEVRDALAKTNIFEGKNQFLPDERIAFDADGQNRFSRLNMMQIQNGSWVTVWPDVYAESGILTM